MFNQARCPAAPFFLPNFGHTPEAYAILAALRDGRTLTAACTAALRHADPATDWAATVQEWFKTWQSLGWFCRRPIRRKSSRSHR